MNAKSILMKLKLAFGRNLTLKPLLDTLSADTPPADAINIMQDSGIAFIRDNRWFALLDASHATDSNSHYHDGNNSLTLWYRDRPFIVDSDCGDCNLSEFTTYFKHAKAHSTILLNDKDDGESSDGCEWLDCANAKLLPYDENGHLAATLTSTAPNWNGVTWQRSIFNKKEIFILEDQLVASSENKVDFIFNLHPDVKVTTIGPNAFTLENNDVSLYVSICIFDAASQNSNLAAFDVREPLEATITQVAGKFCDSTTIAPSQQIHIKVKGKKLLSYIHFTEF